MSEVPPLLVACEVIIDGSGTHTVAIRSVGAPFIEDGTSSGCRPMNPGNVAIDDVLLDYCTLNVDSAIRGNEATASCKFCGVAIRSQTSFVGHLRSMHRDLDIKPYRCSECPYKGGSKSNLQQHILQSHAGSRKYACRTCCKGFIYKYKLDLHLKSHENKREYACDKCGHAFNSQQDLIRHKKNVHFPEETAVKCPTCGRLFKDQGRLDMHVHVHTGEKEFICEVCNKKFSTRESLRSHMKGHVVQFSCEICSKQIGSYSSFIIHKRLHDPNCKSYDCGECGKSFPYETTLKRHKLSAHSTERVFKCDQCSQDFKRSDHLKRHLVIHEKDKRFSCDTCGHRVKTLEHLHKHMIRHASVTVPLRFM